MKRNIFIVFLILFLGSCGKDNIDKKIEDLNNETIISINPDKKISNVSNEKKIIEVEKNIFSNILKQISDLITEKDFFSYFVVGDNEIYFAGKYFYLPGEEQDFIRWFKSHFEKRFIIENFKNSKDVLSSNIEKNYKNEAREYLFLNTKKDYLFNLSRFYEMNGVCLLVFGEIDSFFDVNGDLVKPNIKVNLDDKNFLSSSIDFYINDLNGDLLSKNDLKKILDKKIYNYIEVEKILYSLVYFYDKEKDKYYIEKFYEIFYNNLSIKYSYEVFTLFFKLKLLEGNKSNFCDKFNQEYFLGK